MRNEINLVSAPSSPGLCSTETHLYPENAHHQRPYLSSRTRPHGPYRCQGLCGSPACHTSLVNPSVERVTYTHQAQGGAFVQRRRRERHMSHPQQRGHRNHRRPWSLIFCFHVSSCQKGPKGHRYSITTSPGNAAGIEHSCFLRN